MSAGTTSENAAHATVPRSISRLVGRAALPPERAHDPWSAAPAQTRASLRREPSTPRPAPASEGESRPTGATVAGPPPGRVSGTEPHPRAPDENVSSDSTKVSTLGADPPRTLPVSAVGGAAPASPPTPTDITTTDTVRTTTDASDGPGIDAGGTTSPVRPKAARPARSPIARMEAADTAELRDAASPPSADVSQPGSSPGAVVGTSLSPGTTDSPAATPSWEPVFLPAPNAPAPASPIESPVTTAAPPVQIGRIEVLVTAPEPPPDPFAGCHALEAASDVQRGGGW